MVESIRLITGRRRFNSFRADSRGNRGELIEGTKALVAERLALNQVGEGSSPSGPTGRNGRLHWSSSGEDTAPVMRRRGFESHPVPSVSLTIRTRLMRAHDVVAAYRLAMAEARVRLPLGTSGHSPEGDPIRDVGKPG